MNQDDTLEVDVTAYMTFPDDPESLFPNPHHPHPDTAPLVAALTAAAPALIGMAIAVAGGIGLGAAYLAVENAILT